MWIKIWTLPFLTEASYEKEPDTLAEELRTEWESFCENELPRFREAVRAEPWIWASGTSDQPGPVEPTQTSKDRSA